MHFLRLEELLENKLHKKRRELTASFNEETTYLNETPIIKLHSPILSDIALLGFNLWFIILKCACNKLSEPPRVLGDEMIHMIYFLS